MATPRSEDARPRILVVDDEASITDLITTALRFTGYEVASAKTGMEALRAIAAFQPDCIVLDVMLPDLDGYEICRRLRRDGNPVPVLFLTARDTTDDRVQGFVEGGDDYVPKPFSLEELSLRIAALLRRTRPVAAESGNLRYADLEIDEMGHRVTRSGEEIQLSPTEYRLLVYLMRNSNRVLSKAQILDHLRDDPDGDGNVVEGHVSTLRRKVDAGRPRLIHTVRGFGYTLRGERSGDR